ncbi:MAG: T9SS type A sorting domain-containing protein [Bacteroidia bacterium]|nr:T9SS type A sorting domain-containing protein [Bacteroidia bacterium]
MWWNKKIFGLLICIKIIIHSFGIKAQESQNPFSQLDSSKWAHPLFSPTDLSKDLPSIIGHKEFSELYITVNQLWGKNLQKKGIQAIRDIDSLFLIAQLFYEQYQLIPSGIIAIDYTTFTDFALDSGYILFQNGYFIENTNDISKMYQSKRLFVAAPLLPSEENNEYLLFHPLFSIVSDTTDLYKVYIKHNNTILSPFTTPFLLNTQDTLKVLWTKNNNDSSLWQLKLFSNDHLSGNTYNIASSAGTYSTEISVQQNCQNISIPKIPPFPPPSVYVLNACPTAKVTVYYSCNNQTYTIQKPFVLVEGFDPGTPSYILNNSLKGTRYNYGCLNWETIKNGDGKSAIESCLCSVQDNSCNQCIKEKDLDKDGYLDYENLKKAPQLINKLHNEGFDVIYVEFKYSTFSLSFNTTVMEEVIRWINQNKSGKHKIILAGASMGGLITRMALIGMEQNSEQHQVRDWITFDSPHNGANIPFGDQLLIKWLSETNETKSPDVLDAKSVLNSPAATNMLLYHYTNSSYSSNNYSPNLNFPFGSNSHNYFPKKIRNSIAIANGSSKGYLFGFSAGAKMLELNTCCIKGSGLPFKGKVFAETYSITDYYSTSVDARLEICIAGMPTYIHISNNAVGIKIDNAPGGYRRGNKSIVFQGGNAEDDGKHCFVPTISALSIKKSVVEALSFQQFGHSVYNPHINLQWIFNSSYSNYIPHPNICYVKNPVHTPFKVLYAPDNNQQHVEITDDNINFIMNEIAPADLYLQNETYPLQNLPSDADQFEARNSITAGKNVTPKTAVGDFVVGPNANITFRAGNKIVLKDGFSAKAGSTFRAYIDPFDCPPAQRLSSSNPSDSKTLPENSEGALNTYSFTQYSSRAATSTLFPNPTSSLVHLQLPIHIENTYTLKITNLFGQSLSLPIQKLSDNVLSIDFSNVAEGVYIVHYSDNEGNVFTNKVVVKR